MSSNQPPKLGKRLLTARTDIPDFRDYMYEPALINLKAKMGVPQDLNIRDQGSLGACTGFGLAAAIDMQIKGRATAQSKKLKSVSARMLYEMAKRYDEWPGALYEGSSCRGAIKGWYNMGVCDESLYPYATSGGIDFSVDAAKDARKNTIGAYYRLGKRISDYHAALNEVGAIYCSAIVHDGWNRPNKQNGKITLQKTNTGGHAFAIVGYDDVGFRVQNSWGANWGLNGTALWTYEDWLINIQDAWVFRMALPTPQIWHLPAKSGDNAGTAKKSTKPTRAEIAGHFLHIDDGHFHDSGRYWSNLNDVQITANRLATSPNYDHLLFYAHGGLNSPAASARRIAAMKETFKANGIYPYHLMYDTGILEELKDILIGRRSKAAERAGGFTDWLDKLVEKVTRVPGRAMWREMKAGARLPFKSANAGSEALNAFIEEIKQSGQPKKIHLVGHSTGMILLAHLLQRLSVLAPHLAVSSVSLMAPAGTLDLFSSHMQPLLKSKHPAFRISEMAIYNLKDDLEQDDEVTKAYNKSLLYLVSRAFEEDLPARILGMEIYSKLIERRNISRLNVHYSEGEVSNARITTSETHGGFDNDVLTMNHVLRRVLGKKPLKDFTQDDLDY